MWSMGMLEDIGSLALVVELITQWVRSIARGLGLHSKFLDILAHVFAYFLGVGLAFAFGVNIFGVFITHPIHSTLVNLAGTVIAGLIAGRGGHFLNQYIANTQQNMNNTGTTIESIYIKIKGFFKK